MGVFMMPQRCPWSTGSQLYLDYHDVEWGVPLHDDQRLFEMLVLEGAQAGLSWSTILNKRAGYRQAFDGFDAEKVARYDEQKVQELLSNAGIIRNRLKIQAAIQNAQLFLQIRERYGSFDTFLWQFVDGKPIQNHRETLQEVPASTKESDVMSKALKKLGFRFVGTTICYAFMQATGMVNDHVVTCFRWDEIKTLNANHPSSVF
jgi:DNA-3-methyladenine glycosylase I